MSGAGQVLADQVAGAIKGQAAADRALEQVRIEIAHPDALHVAAMTVWEEHGTPGLLGFHRRLQKALERQAA